MWLIRTQSKPPLTHTHPELITSMLPPKILAPLTPIHHIHWEIANPPLLHQQHEKNKKKETKIDDKVTINTPYDPGTTGDDTPNNPYQDSGSTDSYLLYSLKKFKFAPYSTTTMKNQKNKERKFMIKLESTPPLLPTHPVLIPPTIPPKMLPPMTPIPHSQWEIKDSPPTPSPPQKTRKERKGNWW